MISSIFLISRRLLTLCALCAGLLQAQSLSIVSGNGQLIATQALSNNPMIVQAKDASGRPVPNAGVTWAITQGAGTLTGAGATTDANGQASANFLSTSLQLGISFQAATVTASSSYGSVSFTITTVISSALQPIVSIELDSPTLDNPTLTAASGSVIPGGVVVRVFAAGGPQSGSPIPNVGVQIVNGIDPTMPAPASCSGPANTVLTDSSGTATCNVMVSGPAGTTQLRAAVGGIQYTRPFSLTITSGPSCQYSLSASSQSFGSNGGPGSVNVTTSAGCGWTAASNAGFITITSGASGSNNGTVNYNVQANTGPARSGTLTIAGLTYTVNQAAGGSPGSLTITTLPTLNPGTVNVAYSNTLTATGGTPPYQWSPAGPLAVPGLSLAPSGAITGTPTSPGSYQLTATVTDSAGGKQSQMFTITINSSPPPTGTLTILNGSFPTGLVGQSYPAQVLLSAGGCLTPFAPFPAFSISKGALPDGLSIQTNSDGSHSIAGTPTTPGSSTFTLMATDRCGDIAKTDFTITITGTPTAVLMLVSPASLAFTVLQGTANSPADQTISLSSNSTAVDYSIAVSTSAGGNWLALRSANNGTTPGSATIGIANFSALNAGTYNGSVSITSTASNSPVVVSVTLTVLPAVPLTVSPTSFTVSQTVSSSAPVSRQAISLASGTSSIPFTAAATTNKGGSWLAVSPTQGSTPTTLTAIITSSGLAIGQYMGTIAITPSSGTPQNVTITLNVIAPAALSATPAPLAFNYQQAGSLPGNQTVTVSSSGGSLNIAASASTLTGGTWLNVSPPNSVTPANLAVSVSPVGLGAGTYSGTITIAASDAAIAALTIPVTLTVAQAAPTLTALTNGASFAPGPVAPGEIVTIFGSGMGPSTLATLHITEAGTIDSTLAGTQVFFDGYAAPLIYSSSTAVSAIVPYEIAGSSTTSVMIQFQGTRSNNLTIPVLNSVPGIFTINASGFGQGAIVNEDGTVNSSQNGADPGSVVSIYATGGGQTDPPSVDGAIATEAATTKLQVKVQIAGENAEVLYGGAAPGEPSGVLQVNARIPADVPRGAGVPVTIMVGVASSQAGVTLAIKP